MGAPAHLVLVRRRGNGGGGDGGNDGGGAPEAHLEDVRQMPATKKFYRRPTLMPIAHEG